MLILNRAGHSENEFPFNVDGKKTEHKFCLPIFNPIHWIVTELGKSTQIVLLTFPFKLLIYEMNFGHHKLYIRGAIK